MNILSFFSHSPLNFCLNEKNEAEISNDNYYNLSTVTIPSKVTIKGVKYPVTTIRSFVFSNCKNLIKISMHNSITTIEDGAFYLCSNLREITIPHSVKTIGESAFQGCSNLVKVSIPNSVTSIGNGTFHICI